MNRYSKIVKEVKSVIDVVEDIEKLLKVNALSEDNEDEIESLIELLVEDEGNIYLLYLHMIFLIFIHIYPNPKYLSIYLSYASLTRLFGSRLFVIYIF